MTWWRRLPRRKWVLAAALPLALVCALTLPSPVWILVMPVAVSSSMILGIRTDRRYLADARARDRAADEAG